MLSIVQRQFVEKLTAAMGSAERKLGVVARE